MSDRMVVYRVSAEMQIKKTNDILKKKLLKN